MKDVAIISTSINPNPHAYAVWAKRGDLIIAGDRNTPDELYDFVTAHGGRYMLQAEQDQWSSSVDVGWNCIQRRNFAAMQAYAEGYRYVLTVDDDNIPTESMFVEKHVDHIEHGALHAARVRGKDWVNTGDFVRPPTRQRGTPYGVDTTYRYDRRIHAPIAVSQAQIVGSPDCDAVTRIAVDPMVDYIEQDVVVTGGWFAFNSQATLWHGDLAPLLACLPGVGRYDDIFASLIAQTLIRMKNLHVYVGGPAARQDRNEHDVEKDLINELYGMDRIFRVTEALSRFEEEMPPDIDGMTLYAACATYLQDALPARTIKFMLSWANDWSKAMELRREAQKRQEGIR